ncbi:ribosome silencing factor [Tistlia consotensis]|uniref:ribosome silencing factor n=1 Tax=Tistlia consotensis TaxID=1321365 RepID=UPI002AC3316F|nr:ribosome silencing factor [Tistlia consotensis]
MELTRGILDDGKAEDVVVIDLSRKSSFADTLVIATGRNQRQIAALAARLQQGLKAATGLPVAVEGLRSCDWVLIDAGDIVVHLFRPEVREFYNLEKMWGMAPATPQPHPQA